MLGKQASIRTGDDQAFETLQIDLQSHVLRNRGMLVHIIGLGILHQLGCDDAAVRSQLQILTVLQPRQLVDDATLETLLVAQIEMGERLATEREALLPLAKESLEHAFIAYTELETLVTIQPTDPWNVVVGKARSLRDLGRYADAAAAFARYGELFAPTDPTAAQYAHIAQHFTLHCDQLGVYGGAYIAELALNGAAAQAGLAVGDIVIGYGDHVIHAMPDLQAALQAPVLTPSVPVIYLRIDAHDRWIRALTCVTTGVPGANFLPI